MIYIPEAIIPFGDRFPREIEKLKFELTIDNEQLTIKESLRDDLDLKTGPKQWLICKDRPVGTQ